MAKENIIQDKTMQFSLQIIELYKFLQLKKEFVLSKQLLRSGTSIGAMIRESTHAESKADFIHKFSIAQKEANESSYWIELLYKSEYINAKQYQNINDKLNEIQKIIASILISMKNK